MKRSPLIRRALLLLLASILVSATGKGDSLVVPGIGTIDSWDTEFELSNPYPYRLSFQIGGDPTLQRSCPGFCNFATLGIPPKGSLKLRQADIFRTNQLYVLWVLPLFPGFDVPTLRARVFNTSNPTQAVEVPVTRLSTISAQNVGVLGFPSATRTQTAHSNLILANLDTFVDSTTALMAEIELFSPEGILLGGMIVTIQARGLLFLTDAVKALGVENLDTGQIVVTKASPGGTPWGFLATVDSAGTVTVSPGRNP